MKINVEFDLTPAEFRQSMGLPDVEAFQRDLMQRIQDQMAAGVEGYDPWSLFQPFMQQGMTQGLGQGLSQGMANFSNYQQMMLDMMRQAASSPRERPDSAESEERSSGGGNRTGSRSRSSASATSRQSRTKTQSRSKKE